MDVSVHPYFVALQERGEQRYFKRNSPPEPLLADGARGSEQFPSTTSLSVESLGAVQDERAAEAWMVACLADVLERPDAGLDATTPRSVRGAPGPAPPSRPDLSAATSSPT